jgi:hypothetical protein
VKLCSERACSSAEQTALCRRTVSRAEGTGFGSQSDTVLRHSLVVLKGNDSYRDHHSPFLPSPYPVSVCHSVVKITRGFNSGRR